jgi:hypothetical protein
LFAALIPALAFGQASPNNKVASSMQQYAPALALQCHEMAEELVKDPEFAPSFKIRPANLDEICRCTVQSVVTDPRIRERFEASAETLYERLKSDALKSYFFLRVTNSVLSCFVKETEVTLQAITLSEP